MGIVQPLWEKARRHGFLALLAALLLVEYGFARATDWESPGPAEAAILFDLCLFIPALYLLLHRRSVPRRQLVVRTAALSLLGLWVASLLVPSGAQRLLLHLAWLRPGGLVLLTLIELRLLVAALKMVWSGGAGARQVAERSGAPEWLARLMLIEARFWKAVWRMIRGR